MSRPNKSAEVWAYDAELGRRLRMTRMARGLTQEDMARQLGMLPQTLSAYENGVASCIPAKLALLAHFLGVSVSALMPRYTKVI